MMGPSEPLQHKANSDEQIVEENVSNARDEQTDRDLLRLVGPADLNALIVLHCNETI